MPLHLPHPPTPILFQSSSNPVTSVGAEQGKRTENNKRIFLPVILPFFFFFFPFLPFSCCFCFCLRKEFLSHETGGRNGWALQKHYWLKDGSGSHNVVFVLKDCQVVSGRRKEGTSGSRGWLWTQRCQTRLSLGGK